MAYEGDGPDWGEFFSRIGSTVGQWAQYRAAEDEKKEKRVLEEKELAATQAERTYQHGRDRVTDLHYDQEALRKPAETRAGEFAKRGIIMPTDYVQQTAGAGLPDTQGSGGGIGDAGSMAVGALRSAGQGRQSDYARQGTEALNQAYTAQTPGQAFGNGGMAMVEPSVLQSFQRAAQDRSEGVLNRQSRENVARIGADATRDSHVVRPGDPNPRAKMIAEYAEKLMKPGVYEDGWRKGQPNGIPGLSEVQALAKAKRIVGQAYGEDAPAEPAAAPEVPLGTFHNFLMPGTQAMDPQERDDARIEIQGMSDEDARQKLTAAGFGPQDIHEILGQ